MFDNAPGAPYKENDEVEILQDFDKFKKGEIYPVYKCESKVLVIGYSPNGHMVNHPIIVSITILYIRNKTHMPSWF